MIFFRLFGWLDPTINGISSTPPASWQLIVPKKAVKFALFMDMNNVYTYMNGLH
jgi:hypothetical protein